MAIELLLSQLDLFIQHVQLILTGWREQILVHEINFSFAVFLAGENGRLGKLVKNFDALCTLQLMLEVVKQVLHGIRSVLLLHPLGNGLLRLLVCEGLLLLDLLELANFGVLFLRHIASFGLVILHLFISLVYLNFTLTFFLFLIAVFFLLPINLFIPFLFLSIISRFFFSSLSCLFFRFCFNLFFLFRGFWLFNRFRCCFLLFSFFFGLSFRSWIRVFLFTFPWRFFHFRLFLHLRWLFFRRSWLISLHSFCGSFRCSSRIIFIFFIHRHTFLLSFPLTSFFNRRFLLPLFLFFILLGTNYSRGRGDSITFKACSCSLQLRFVKAHFIALLAGGYLG